MALFECKYPSTIMNKCMALNVILPDDEDQILDNAGKYPVVFLLHGYTDDYSKWIRMTSIERYATEKGIAIVMPDAGKSFYTDMAHGDPYFTYITEESILVLFFSIFSVESVQSELSNSADICECNFYYFIECKNYVSAQVY